MKNGRKLLSIILTICMVMQILPVFATETGEIAEGGSASGTGITYLINDDFSAPAEGDYTAGTDGWSLATDTDFTDYAQDILTTEEIIDADGNGTDNYAMKYTVTSANWDQTHIEKAVTRADGTPVTFETGTDVVIETRMANSSTLTGTSYGRSYLKYNLPTDADSAEWNLNFGSLVYFHGSSTGGDIYGINGWNTKTWTLTNEDESTSDVTYYYAAASTKQLTTFEADTYYNIKVVIHGTTDGTANTADYYVLDDDGSVLYSQTGCNIKHPGDVEWSLNGTSSYSTDPATWVENVLNTIDFRQRNANTLYVDYVRAYEVKQESVQANLADGRYVQYNSDINIKLTTEAEKLTLIEDTVKLTNVNGEAVEASVSYDDTNKTLSVNPIYDLTVGGIYTLTLTDNDFNTFTGTTEFTIEARAARSNGVVFNDTFDNMEVATGVTEASGWYLGAVKDGITKGTLDIVQLSEGNNALVVNVNDSTSTTNSEQTNLTKKYGGGIEYKENKDIIIKTRIKNATTSTTGENRAMLMLNRPDSVQQPGAFGNNIFAWFCVRDTGMQSAKNYESTPSVNMYSNKLFTESLLNSWVNVEIKLTNGSGYTIKAVKEVEDGDDVESAEFSGDVTQNPVIYEHFYGEGTDVTAFDALERLTFIFRSSTSQKLYIDYIEVYEVNENIEISVDETYKPGEAIDVKFNVSNGDASFLDAVKLFKGDTEITGISKSINETNNVVTIEADTLEKGAYKVVVDTETEGFPKDAYKFTVSEQTIQITDKKYLVYDEFGKDDTEGWIDAVYDGQTSTNVMEVVAEEDGSANYVLKYTAADESNSYYGYITKSLLTPAEFNNDNNVVIEARVKQNGTGRTYLKYNLGATAPAYNQSEWNVLWANLIMNETGSISLHNGYTYSSDYGYYSYPYGFGGTSAAGGNEKLVTGATDTWLTYKVVIHGGTAGENHTATGNTADYYIYDENGNELASKTGFDIDFPDSSTWGWGGTTAAEEISWLEDALYSVDFRLRKAETLSIDYVKVYEYSEVNAVVNTAEGKTFEAGKAIEFTVTGEDGAEVPVTIADTVTASVEAEVAYENGILTVTPAEAEAGDTVTVTFTASEYVKFPNSTTSFTLTARGERETGVIINDDFTDGTDEWVQGVSNITTTVEQDTTTFEGKSVLKITTTDEAANNSAGYQPVAFKALGDGVAIEEGKQIVIKTAIYVPEAATGRFDLKFNRPNSATQVTGTNDYVWLAYGLLRNDSTGTGTPNAGVPRSIYSSTHTHPYFVADNKLTDAAGNVLNPEGKWVDYTFEIGDDETMTVTAVADGTEYTASGIFKLQYPAYEDIYGTGVADARVKALESLTFKNTVPNEPVYIDYITVYDDSAIVSATASESVRFDKAIKIKLETAGEIAELDGAAAITGIVAEYAYDAETKTITLTPAEDLTVGESVTVTLDKSKLEALGFIYEGEESYTVKVRDNIIFDYDFNDGNLGDWVLGNTTEDASKYAYGVADGAMYLEIKEGMDKSDSPALYLDFADVEYEEGSTIIIEAKIKQTGTTANHRSYLKLNRPNITTFTGGSENGHNWYTIGTLRGDGYQTTGASDHTVGQNVYTPASGENMGDKWVDVTIELDGVNKVAYTTVTVDGETTDVVTSTIADGKDALANAGAPETGYTAFDSLTWIFRSSAGANKLYVDEIKAYEKLNVSVTTDATAMPGYNVVMKGNADIGAYIKTGNVVLENLETYVELYDADNQVVASTKTQVEGTQKVVIDPANDLAEGAYTVVFDKDALADLGYVLEGEAEFTVNVANGADVNLTFDDLAEGSYADDKWVFEESTLTQSADIKKDGTNGYLRITANGETSAAGGKVLTYSKTLDTPFVRDMKASTVFEMRMRTNSDLMRKIVKLNYPNDGDYNVNEFGEVGHNTRNASVMYSGNIGVAYSDYRDQGDGSQQRQGKTVTVASGYETDKWYTIKTIYHNSENTASTYVYDEAGVLVGSLEDQALSAWWYNFYDFNETQPQVMHSIDDITVRFRPNAAGTVTDEQFDIDYIKLYNITEADEYAAAKFMDGEDEVTSITADGSVTPTFEIQSKNNEEADYYVIAAVYNDGRLTKTLMKKVTVTGKQTVTLDAVEVDKDDAGLVVKVFVWNEDMVPVCEATKINPNVYTIYMAADGDDANGGYATAPVATLNRAIELANDAKTQGYSTSEVIVEDGNYELTGETISIGSALEADSLTIRGDGDDENGRAEFINGIALSLENAVKVEDESILKRLEHHDNYETIAANLYAINLRKYIPEGYELEQMNLPGTYSYYCDGYSYGTDGVFEITEPELAADEMFFGGTAMTVARYPDSDYASLGTVTTDKTAYNAGTYNSYYDVQSITRYWMSDKEGTDDYIDVADRTVTPFEVKLDVSSNWEEADQAIAFGFWKWDWATQSTPVSFADGVMTSKYPSHYGLADNGRYYVYNLLEEISQPGEYFVDRNEDSTTYGMMYFYMPKGDYDEITMSLYGSEDTGIIDITANNVTVKDLVFTASRGKAIRIAGENIVVDNCEISGTAHGAVSFGGGAKNSVIKNCCIHDVNGGISLAGGSISNLTAGNNKVLNNTITNFSRLNKTYTDAINVSGVGNTASYNVISKGEHLAIRLSGVNNEVSYNDISKVLTEADDMGAIYHGRSWTARDNKIKFNFIHSLGSTEVDDGDSAIGGIFLDDHTADFEIYGNIFYDIDGHGVRLNQGREHTINNNIFGKLTYPVSGGKASGSASSYTSHIEGVQKLLTNEVWLNSEYASELFNEDKTDYNENLLNSEELTFNNNFVAATSGYTVNGTIADCFTMSGNGSLTNMPSTKAAVTSATSTFDFTGFDEGFLEAIGITE